MSMRIVVDNTPGSHRPPTRARRHAAGQAPIAFRAATSADAPALHALISSHLEEGHLLPRGMDELAVHAPRFVVAVQTARASRSASKVERIVGCAELAPLSTGVAEVRSLVVDRDARKLGLGHHMVDDLGRRARLEGFDRLCAFAHDATFFIRLGFSIVPHTWVPEKIAHDCHSCPLFRNCGQYAVVLELRREHTQTGTADLPQRSGMAPRA